MMPPNAAAAATTPRCSTTNASAAHRRLQTPTDASCALAARVFGHLDAVFGEPRKDVHEQLHVEDVEDEEARHADREEQAAVPVRPVADEVEHEPGVAEEARGDEAEPEQRPHGLVRRVVHHVARHTHQRAQVQEDRVDLAHERVHEVQRAVVEEEAEAEDGAHGEVVHDDVHGLDVQPGLHHVVRVVREVAERDGDRRERQLRPRRRVQQRAAVLHVVQHADAGEHGGDGGVQRGGERVDPQALLQLALVERVESPPHGARQRRRHHVEEHEARRRRQGHHRRLRPRRHYPDPAGGLAQRVERAHRYRPCHQHEAPQRAVVRALLRRVRRPQRR
mmetsp:Transcript_11281/g.39307  ORF Transcript_11281/g.39307 Transcript_11281/m.39307 type:complete len:335 (+) Transcript_11281:87-1091(+)